MSALYSMKYHGVAGEGHGSVYIGNGKVVGTDVTGAKYIGSYNDLNARLVGAATLTSAGGFLVTGQAIPPGTQVKIEFNLGLDFGNGKLNIVTVAGQPVQVSFSKVGDI